MRCFIQARTLDGSSRPVWGRLFRFIRARRPEEKEARRTAILDVARDLARTANTFALYVAGMWPAANASNAAAAEQSVANQPLAPSRSKEMRK